MAFLKKLQAVLTNRIFLKNILSIFVTVFLVIYITLWVLDFYTNHGASYPIDNYIEMDYDLAKELAEKNEFNLVVSDSIYLEGKKTNIVLQQKPDPGTQVKKDRTIYVTLTKVIPDLVTLPSMTGGNDNFDLYSKKLNALGVHSKIKSKVSNFKYAENTIVEVWKGEERIKSSDLKDGFKVPKGSIIECVITKKSVDYIEVPNLKCRTLSEAEFILSSYNLKLGKIDESAITDKNTAYISWQSKPASTVDKIAIGSSINVTLSITKPTTCD